MCCKWCRESCSACHKIKPINGFIPYCPSCKRRSAGWGMRQRARWSNWRSDWTSALCRQNRRGKRKCHTVKNVVLVDKQLTIAFLSQTHPGTVHDKRIADATPYPLPPGSHLLQDLGFLAFTLEGVIIEMPTKKPRGGELTPLEKEANHALAQRRVAIEHVNSSIKRCRILKDVCRLLRSGARDQVMEICCALHNFRLRLDPWLPIS